jgi:hypothetical protein
MHSVISAMNRIFRFYYNGFKNMSWWGNRVWIIILIKLFVIFLILRIFFFNDFLQKNFKTEGQKSEYVLDQLIKSK